MGTAVDLALRSTHVLFATAVLALSSSLVGQWSKELAYGGVHIPAPFSLEWATFAGAFSFLASLLGLASNWVEILEGNCTIVLDGSALVANLVGGIVSREPLDLGWRGSMADAGRTAARGGGEIV